MAERGENSERDFSAALQCLARPSGQFALHFRRQGVRELNRADLLSGAIPAPSLFAMRSRTSLPGALASMRPKWVIVESGSPRSARP